MERGAGIGALISVHPADAALARRAAVASGLGLLVFLALAPFAKLPLARQPMFIPVVQTVLIVNDVVTALILFAQVHVTRSRPLAVVACGYAFAALMATVHLLSFPGVFAPDGLLGGNRQTTGYLYVFWHAGFAAAMLRYAALRRQDGADDAARRASPGRSVAWMLGAAALLTGTATLGSSWLPPMLDGNTYSSMFNIGRYGQWLLTVAALVAISRLRGSTVLDVWLLVVLANYFVEIALVGIFNSGRYDVGFYAGRLFALGASTCVLGLLLFEQARLYSQLAFATRTATSEQRLRAGRETLRQALLAGGIGAWSAELRSDKVWWSVELEEAAGMAPGSFAATRAAFMAHVHPEDIPRLRRAYRKALVTGSDFAVECRFRTVGGDWRWVSGRGRVERGGDQRPLRLFGSVMDISERKQAEADAIALDSSLRNVADHLPVLAWVARPGGAVIWCNRRWHEYTGIGRFGNLTAAWRSITHPQARDEVAAAVDECLASGRPFSKVLHWRGADGQYRPFLLRCVCLRNDDGAIVRWLGTATDISEQHSVEAGLREADHHKDLFLATLAHELRTPLTPVRHAVEVLRRMDLPPEAARMHEVIDRQSLQLSRLVEDLPDAIGIAHGRLDVRKEATLLGAVLRDAIDAVRPLCDGCELGLSPGSEELQLQADPVRLRQLFANLLGHAVKLVAPGGRVSVAARREGTALHVALRHAPAGQQPVDLSGVFEQFSQQRIAAAGHAVPNLGLAVAKGIAAAHGGTIAVVSGAAHGETEIVVVLPVDGSAVAATRA